MKLFLLTLLIAGSMATKSIDYIDELLEVKPSTINDDGIENRLAFIVLRSFSRAFSKIDNPREARDFVFDLHRVYNHDWTFNNGKMSELVEKHDNNSLSDLYVVLKSFESLYQMQFLDIAERRTKWKNREESIH